MHRFRACKLALTALLVVGALVAGPASAQTPALIGGGAAVSEPAERRGVVPAVDPAPSGRSLLVSDSAWLSFRLYGTIDSVQGFEHSFALASCRRRVARSCTNFDGFVPITLLEELDDHPDGYETLIVATGYNDSDGNFVDEVDEIVTRARFHGYERVVWVTLRSNVSYTSPDDAGFAAVFERSNAAIRQIEAAGTYPELVVADWATFARDQAAWFASDGIHLRIAGSYAAGDYISRKMAFLDAQPCPQPASAGAEPIDPCPDPDLYGPVYDLASLYPMGQRGPDARFELSWEGSSSWPAPAWWE